MPAPKAYVSWSSGKDSAMALLVVKRSSIIDVAGILTRSSEAYERVAIHEVREQLLVKQAAALNLPLCNVRLPAPCSKSISRKRSSTLMRRQKYFLPHYRQVRNEVIGAWTNRVERARLSRLFANALRLMPPDLAKRRGGRPVLHR